MLDGTYLSRNFATLGPMIRQPPCDLRSCAWLLHPNIKNQGKGMSEVNRFGHKSSKTSRSHHQYLLYPYLNSFLASSLWDWETVSQVQITLIIDASLMTHFPSIVWHSKWEENEEEMSKSPFDHTLVLQVNDLLLYKIHFWCGNVILERIGD